jgi:tRNA dimethylallyltransferase
MHNSLIVLLGPTGVGKTDLSADIALHFGSEIISCDSRQFFREMAIGTSIPSQTILMKIKHHLIGSLSVRDYYSASLFERDVLKLLPELFIRNKIAIMTGGSGLYIDAVCSGIDEIPDTDPAIRNKYVAMHREQGIEGLRSALKLLDPVHYTRVDLRNYKRIIRALEICETTGLPYSTFMKREKCLREFSIIKIGLQRERNDLYSRINRRVDAMVNDGLEEEARSLYEFRHLNSLNTVGYKELFDFFEGKITFDQAVELIKRNSRRYAKRQMTWWGKDQEINWFHPDNMDEIIRFIEQKVTPCHTDW